MSAQNTDPLAITVEFVYEAAQRHGVKIPTAQYPITLLGQARGYIVMLIMALGLRQNPVKPFPPVAFFGKLKPDLRELLGVRSRDVKTRKPIGGDGSIPFEKRVVTSDKSALVHFPAYHLKAVLKQRKDQPYKVMAFVADEILQFAAPESDDPTILSTLETAASLLPTATLDSSALKQMKPYRRAYESRFKIYWDAAEGKLDLAQYAYEKTNASDLLPYEFPSVELRYAMMLMGEAPVSVAEVDLANGAHQLHFWCDHTRLVLHWDSKPDVSELIAQYEAQFEGPDGNKPAFDHMRTDAEREEWFKKFCQRMLGK